MVEKGVLRFASITEVNFMLAKLIKMIFGMLKSNKKFTVTKGVLTKQ